jgi:ABC-type branched-subunit amino acid transport system substrate-binding protein
MRRSVSVVTAGTAALCAAVLGVAACSSSSSSSGTGASASGSSSSSPTSAAVQGISGTTIKVGGLFESADFAGTQAGFVARIDRANKDHELGKYTIQLVGMSDDAQSASTDLSEAQNLVERQGVYAIAPIVTGGFSSTTASFLQQKGIPYFGAGFTNGFCLPYTMQVSPVGCAIGGAYVNASAVGQVAHAVGKPINQLKWAFVGENIPTGTQADNAYADVAKLGGGQVVYNQAVVPVTVGNLAPIVNAVEATHPDVVWIVTGSQAIAVKGAFKASGFTGALVDSDNYAPGLLKVSPAVATALNGTYVQTTTPVIEQNTALVQQMLKDYTAAGYATKDITFGGEYAYTTADNMIALLKKIAPNFGAVESTLKSGFTYTPPQGGSPISYPFMFDAPTNCGSTLKVENGAYVTVTPFGCTTSYAKISGSTATATTAPVPVG